MLLKYTLFWFVLVVVAILNGTIRMQIYQKFFSELTAHQLSTFTGIILVGFSTWLFNLKWKIESRQQAFYIGLIWFTLTVLFEFIFGHYVIKHPWSRLLYDYNILEGRIWPLFLMAILLIPYFIHKISNR